MELPETGTLFLTMLLYCISATTVMEVLVLVVERAGNNPALN
jgi:hypothetical protein